MENVKISLKVMQNYILEKITDIDTLGMQNEGWRMYLDVQRVIGSIGL
jgi:hypothetical protein